MKRFNKGDAAPDGGSLFRKATTVRMWRQAEPFECESREGTLTGQPGDWLAQDGHGGFYPISAEFHAANYEAVRGEPAVIAALRVKCVEWFPHIDIPINLENAIEAVLAANLVEPSSADGRLRELREWVVSRCYDLQTQGSLLFKHHLIAEIDRLLNAPPQPKAEGAVPAGDKPQWVDADEDERAFLVGLARADNEIASLRAKVAELEKSRNDAIGRCNALLHEIADAKDAMGSPSEMSTGDACRAIVRERDAAKAEVERLSKERADLGRILAGDTQFGDLRAYLQSLVSEINELKAKADMAEGELDAALAGEWFADLTDGVSRLRKDRDGLRQGLAAARDAGVCELEWMLGKLAESDLIGFHGEWKACRKWMRETIQERLAALTAARGTPENPAATAGEATGILVTNPDGGSVTVGPPFHVGRQPAHRWADESGMPTARCQVCGVVYKDATIMDCSEWSAIAILRQRVEALERAHAVFEEAVDRCSEGSMVDALAFAYRWSQKESERKAQEPKP